MKTFKELKKQLGPKKIVDFFAHFKSASHPEEHGIEDKKIVDFFAHFKSASHPEEHGIEEEVGDLEDQAVKNNTYAGLATAHHYHIHTPDEDKVHLGNYAKISHDINYPLLHSPSREYHHNEHIKALDRITTHKDNALKHPTTVYSGISAEFGKKLKKVKTDGVVRSKAYISTSLNHQEAAAFSTAGDVNRKTKEHNNHMMVFHLPEGFHKGRSIKHMAHYPEEQEFLMARGQKFKKIGETKTRNNNSTSIMKSHTIYHHVTPLE